MSDDRRPAAPPAEAEAAIGSALPAEVWLRGNPRPAAVALAASLVAAAIAAGAMVALRPPAWGIAVVAAVCVVGLLAATAFVWSAARPRLACRGGVVEVRLAPLGVQRVPLDVVECVFPGSQPVVADSGDVAARRVNTLVLRLAERAAEWRTRPVAAAWGSWADGTVVFDGRWCEPLTPALAREISTRLLEARRRVAPGPR
jgi:hypothetical protein